MLPPMHNKAQRRAAIEQRMEDLRRGITQTQVFFSKIPPQTVQRQVFCLFHSIIFHPITPCAIELQMIGRPWKKRGWLVGRALHHWMEAWIKPTNNKYIYRIFFSVCRFCSFPLPYPPPLEHSVPEKCFR